MSSARSERLSAAVSYSTTHQRDRHPASGGGSASVVDDYYQQGQLAYQTDGNGVLLASFTDDSNGTPVSVQVGSDPTTAPRYWYVYNGHGDVVALVDATGTPVASYSYDSWGNLLSSSESFSNGWTNPYRYDGRDGARYDAATGLYWLAVRVYDPTLGRFLSRDPLNRAPLFVTDNPYVYAGNNPLSNVDPSGQKVAGASASQVKQAAKKQASVARVQTQRGSPAKNRNVCDTTCQHTKVIAITEMIGGGLLAAVTLGGILASCIFGAAGCGLWFSIGSPQFFLGLRYLADGFQQWHSVTGGVQGDYLDDDMSFLKVLADVLQAVMTIATSFYAFANVAKILNGLQEIVRIFRSWSSLAVLASTLFSDSAGIALIVNSVLQIVGVANLLSDYWQFEASDQKYHQCQLQGYELGCPDN